MFGRQKLLYRLREMHDESMRWALLCCDFNRTAAEDVLQDVYLKVLEDKARFSARSSLRTWVFGVIRNTARESTRKKCITVPIEEPSSRESANLCGSDVVNAMRNLSVMQQQVIFLVFHRELSLSETALILDISLGSVRQHYHRAKQNLKTRLVAYDNTFIEEKH